MRRALPVVLALIAALAVGGFVPVTHAQPAPAPSDRFAIATESRAATHAAASILRSGGSAADAAVAASLVLGVVNPTSSGIGGGGFAMVWDQRERRMVVLDFRETAPRAMAAADLARRPVQDSQRGVLVGTPGEVAGLVELHARWGRKSLAHNAAPAIHAAVGGFVLEPHMARTLATYSSELRASSLLARLFFRNGFALSEGVRVRNPKLGRTLRRIAAQGSSAFYQGEVANDIARAAQAHGGSLAAADLAAYRVVERAPLRVPFADSTVYTMPPPSAGGVLLAQTLLMHDRALLSRLAPSSPDGIHLLAETFRGAMSDRLKAIGDPGFVNVPVDLMLSPAHLSARRKRIGWDRTHAPQRFELPEHGTTHLVVVDAQRNVVSLTTTVNRAFGARIVAPHSGVVLNDELDDFTPPSTMRALGIAGDGPNSPRAGARPVSSMVPTIVIKNQAPWVALGGSGGLRIAPNVAQVLLRVLVHGEAASQAVAAPRFMISATGPELFIEPQWLNDRAVQDLRDKGAIVTESSFPSAVQVVRVVDGRRLEAASDPRKFGLALVE